MWLPARGLILGALLAPPSPTINPGTALFSWGLGKLEGWGVGGQLLCPDQRARPASPRLASLLTVCILGAQRPYT